MATTSSKKSEEKKMASETLWILIKGDKINRHRKTKPKKSDLYSGEVPAKLKISWDESELDIPTIEKDVDISDALGNLRLDDLDVGSPTLTEEEVRMVREKREDEMAQRLRREGYKVIEPDDEEDDDDSVSTPEPMKQ